MPNYPLFATTAKAMESILADELNELGIKQPKAVLAGVAFEGDLETAYRACLWSRTANRILLVLKSFQVKTQRDLYEGVRQIDWAEHLNPEGSFAVTFSVKNSTEINNSHFGTLKVKDAVVDQFRDKFGVRPSIKTDCPDIRINVHLNGENAQLSLDLSGESLHRRGYRDISIEAPIKENLAAAMLLRSGWPKIARQQGTLLDPMCGSGTLLLEGAMIAADYAPGLLRNYYGFLGWKKHDAACWRKLLAEAEQRKQAGLSKLPAIVGFDQNRQTVNAARTHIANAGLHNKIHVERREIADAAPAESWKPGLLICNPPYGERLGDEAETAELYKRFGLTLKQHFVGWQAAMIISDPELGFRLGIRSQKPVTLFNGALECKLLRMNIQPESFFIPKAKTQEERIEHISESGRNEAADHAGAEMFANRLKKNLKKLSGWVKKNDIHCYRAYDADLPEYAAAVDIYRGIPYEGKASATDQMQTWVHVQEYEPPKSVDQHKADRRLAGLLAETAKVLDLPADRIFLKIRRKQKSSDQYEKHGDHGRFYITEEGGCRLLVNFEDYLDTGLFLDHRPIRSTIQREAEDKRFLNLFAYTGSATVHAAVGGAKATTTVDMSNTYINWAKKNMALNKTRGEHEFIQADCLDWLATEADLGNRHYDLIFLDPPTFSNSKRMDRVFDIQADHVQLIEHAVSLLSPGGVLYFSTNFRRFKIDKQALSELILEDISAATVPEDFARDPKIHYCWRIKE